MAKRVNPFVCDCGKPYTPKKGQDPRIKCAVCVKQTTSREVKAKAVAYLGGKCVDCHFVGPDVAYDFDHRDGERKEFKISGHYKFRWKELRKELDKCDLRCCRCHRIRHYEIEILSNLSDSEASRKLMREAWERRRNKTIT